MVGPRNFVLLWLAKFLNFHTRLVNSDCSRKLTSSGLSSWTSAKWTMLICCFLWWNQCSHSHSIKNNFRICAFSDWQGYGIYYIFILHLCLYTFVFDEGFVDCIAESCTRGSLRRGSRPRVSLLVLHQAPGSRGAVLASLLAGNLLYFYIVHCSKKNHALYLKACWHFNVLVPHTL